MQKFKALLLMAIVGSLLGSCTQTSSGAHVLLLFDNSQSTAPQDPQTSSVEDRRPDFLNAAAEIVSGAGPGVTIQAGRITDQSLRITRLPVDVTFPSFNPAFDNPHIYSDRLLKAKREAIGQIYHAINDKERTRQTCIIDSLILAEQVFTRSPQARKMLVIMSDMAEDCGAIDFDTNPRPGTHTLPHDSTESNKLLERLKKEQKIPNLKGTEIYIYGATGGQKHDDNSTRFMLTRNWWKAFFQATGADVKDYGVFSPPVFEQSTVNVALKPDDLSAVGR